MLVKLWLLLAIVSCIQAECEQQYCANGTTHVGCIQQTTFSENCGAASHLFVKVDGSLREQILAKVNVLRNSVASGLFNMSAAARMPTMGWDSHLAKLANVLVHLCDPGGKLCSNTEKYRYVATVELSGTSTHYLKLIKNLLDITIPAWFSDLDACRMDSDNHIHPNGKDGCVGHYIPLIEDHGDRMGCAIRLTRDDNPKVRPSATMICNLSRANVNDMPPYAVGKVPGEDCQAGTHNNYKFLCDPDEVVDYNYVVAAKSKTPCDEKLEKKTK